MHQSAFHSQADWQKAIVAKQSMQNEWVQVTKSSRNEEKTQQPKLHNLYHNPTMMEGYRVGDNTRTKAAEKWTFDGEPYFPCSPWISCDPSCKGVAAQGIIWSKIPWRPPWDQSCKMTAPGSLIPIQYRSVRIPIHLLLQLLSRPYLTLHQTWPCSVNCEDAHCSGKTQQPDLFSCCLPSAQRHPSRLLRIETSFFALLPIDAAAVAQKSGVDDGSLLQSRRIWTRWGSGPGITTQRWPIPGQNGSRVISLLLSAKYAIAQLWAIHSRLLPV